MGAPPGTLSGSEKLEGDLVGWDSMAVVSFIAMVDDRLGTTLPPAEIAAAKTVDDLVALAADKLSG